jgi:hypothetical protein
MGSSSRTKKQNENAPAGRSEQPTDKSIVSGTKTATAVPVTRCYIEWKMVCSLLFGGQWPHEQGK